MVAVDANTTVLGRAARIVGLTGALAVGILGSVGVGTASADVEVSVTCPVFLNDGSPAGALTATGHGRTPAEAVQDVKNKARAEAPHRGGFVNPDLCR